MKTSPASIRDSWAYQKWGAKGARTYLNVTFATLETKAFLLLAAFAYFTFINPLLAPKVFALACCFFLLAAVKLFCMHRNSLREVEGAGASQCNAIAAKV